MRLVIQNSNPAGREKVQLLDLAMYGFFPQDRVVLEQLEPVGRILAVLLGDITGSAGHTGVLVLGTLQNDHDAVPFLLLSHGCRRFSNDLFQFNAGVNALLLQFLEIGVKAQLVDGAHFRSADLKRDPLIRFRHVEALFLDIGQKTAPRFAVGVRNGIARNGALTG